MFQGGDIVYRHFICSNSGRNVQRDNRSSFHALCHGFLFACGVTVYFLFDMFYKKREKIKTEVESNICLKKYEL